MYYYRLSNFIGKLKLFFKWGIEFDKDHPYCPLENGSREVAYASKSELIDSIIQKYYPALQKNNDNTDNEDDDESGGQSQVLSNSNFAEVRTERGVDIKVSPKASEMLEKEDGQNQEGEKDDDEKPEYFEEDFTVTEGYNE